MKTTQVEGAALVNARDATNANTTMKGLEDTKEKTHGYVVE